MGSEHVSLGLTPQRAHLSNAVRLLRHEKVKAGENHALKLLDLRVTVFVRHL